MSHQLRIMLKSLRQLFIPKHTGYTDGKLDYNALPVLTADQLIAKTQQYNRLRHIKRIVQIDDKRYEALYLNAIERFAEIVQLMPASQAHHHAVPGGLFIHTAEVIEIALSLRQQYKLPSFATQEVQEAEKHVWTYAIFVAALLHDIGKRLTLCKFILDDGSVFDPFTHHPASLSGRTYHIVFQDRRYHALHEQLGLTFACLLLPPVAQSFLLTQMHIMKELMGYIHNDTSTEGIIGKILKEADQKSTGQSLAHSPSRKFPGADIENIGERLMTQLRALIASQYFVMNKKNASIYTSATGYTYLVSKVMADELRSTLAADGITDIPHDNNRIFDIFGEYGFAESNEKGQVIHYISRVINGSIQNLSVLKFKTNKLFRVQPATIEDAGGQLEEITNKHAIANIAKKGESSIDTQIAETPEISNPETATISNPETASLIQSETGAGKNSSDSDSDVEKNKNTQIPETKQIPETEDIGLEFLSWCRDKIKTKQIIINESGTMIQKVRYKNEAVIGVITPKTFLNFGVERYGLPKHKSTAERIQAGIHKLKLNIPGPKGQLHIYKILKSQNNPLGGHAKIFLYLFDLDKFVGGDEDVRVIIDKININANLDEA